MNDVIIIGGGKGGVGKSSVAMGVVDVLRQSGNEVFVIDCDDTNPDVFKAFEETEVECVVRPLDNEDGAIRLGSLVQKHPDSCVIINTAARSKLCENIGIFVDVCKQAGRDLLTLWPINQERDSLELASDYLEACEGSPLFVVVNTYFGDSADFEEYHVSKLKKSVKTIVYPALSRVVAKKINFERLNYENATTQRDRGGEPFFDIAESSALFRFRDKAKAALSAVFESR